MQSIKLIKIKALRICCLIVSAQLIRDDGVLDQGAGLIDTSQFGEIYLADDRHKSLYLHGKPWQMLTLLLVPLNQNA